MSFGLSEKSRAKKLKAILKDRKVKQKPVRFVELARVDIPIAYYIFLSQHPFAPGAVFSYLLLPGIGHTAVYHPWSLSEELVVEVTCRLLKVRIITEFRFWRMVHDRGIYEIQEPQLVYWGSSRSYVYLPSAIRDIRKALEKHPERKCAHCRSSHETRMRVESKLCRRCKYRVGHTQRERAIAEEQDRRREIECLNRAKTTLREIRRSLQKPANQRVKLLQELASKAHTT